MGHFGSKYDINDKYRKEYNMIRDFVMNKQALSDELSVFANSKPKVFWYIISVDNYSYRDIIHVCNYLGYDNAIDIKIQNGPYYWNILFAAINSNDIETVNKLIDAGCNIEILGYVNKTKCDMSPLQYAVLYSLDDIVELLVEKGANVDYDGPFGLSPVLISMINKNETCCKSVIRKMDITKKYSHLVRYYGMDILIKIEDGDTIFDFIRNNYIYIHDDIIFWINDEFVD